jgi:hypothetical protein
LTPQDVVLVGEKVTNIGSIIAVYLNLMDRTLKKAAKSVAGSGGRDVVRLWLLKAR